MKKSELNAMLDVLDEYSTAHGLYRGLGDEKAAVVADGVRAIKRALKAAGVPMDIVRDCCNASYARGIARAREDETVNSKNTLTSR